MTKLTFKDVAHHYLGIWCMEMDNQHPSVFKIDQLNQSLLEPERFIPILYPTDKMPEDHARVYIKLFSIGAGPEDSIIESISNYITSDLYTTSEFIWLTSPDHPYNIFGLEPDQFIDATTLNHNPYENQ